MQKRIQERKGEEREREKKESRREKKENIMSLENILGI